MKAGLFSFLMLFSTLVLSSDNYKYRGPQINGLCISKNKQSSKKEFGLLENKSSIVDILKKIDSYCLQPGNDLASFFESQFQAFHQKQVHHITLREFDEILFQFLKDKKEENCKIQRVFNVKDKWILSYQEKNTRCL